MKFRKVKDTCWIKGHTKNTNALLAVMELHKPVQTDNGEWGCGECVKVIRPEDKSMTYRHPCPTVQAIEKELK